MADTLLEQSVMVENKIKELFPDINFNLMLKRSNGFDELHVCFCNDEGDYTAIEAFNEWLIADIGLRIRTISACIFHECQWIPLDPHPPRSTHIHALFVLVND